MTGRVPLYEDAIDWLQCNYPADLMGAYVEPASTVLFQSAVVEGDKLFPDFHWHLWRLYPGDYAPATDDPVAPTGRDPVCRESYMDRREERY